MTETVKVVVRKRPLNSSEKSRGNYNIILIDRDINRLAITHPQSKIEKTFTYDAVYDESCTQRLVYDETAFPLVDSVISGYNGTIFAYGQTGCGKSYTMMGESNDTELAGIIPNSFSHIFGCIAESQQGRTFLVRCSYCEIYNEEVRDLLNYNPNTKLELKETKDKGIFIKNLSLRVVRAVQDIEKAMEIGNTHRITKETQMNERSSRSHAIFTIYIETSEELENRQVLKAGKLNLVDLAGSERQKKTGAVGERLKEAIEINLSLSALGNVISSLVDGKVTHIPYRDSKLTRLLQDSLGGNTKTVMIAVVSPADYNYDESLSTLRYASRAKFIQNKPKINEDPKDALLRQYLDEISKLKQLLNGQGEPIIIEKVVEREVHQEPPLSSIQGDIIHGGELHDFVLEQKLRAQRAFRKKLAKQRKRMNQLIEEKEKKEEELIARENCYNSLQDEVLGLKQLNKKLKIQYKSALAEIEDISHEFEVEKEGMLDNLRELEYECAFLMKSIGFLLPSRELESIREKSKFDKINNQWKVPPFLVQNKQVIFPKIARKQAMEMIINELDNRVVIFEDEKEVRGRGNEMNSQKQSSKKQFLVNQRKAISYPNDKISLPQSGVNRSSPVMTIRKANQKFMKNPKHIRLQPIRNPLNEG